MDRKYPDQTVFFASWNRPKDVKALSDLLIGQSTYSFGFAPLFNLSRSLWEPRCGAYLTDIAKRNTHAPELNVLVVGMPNVGKSTLLNALRNTGISGRKHVLLSPAHVRPMFELYLFYGSSYSQGIEDVSSAWFDTRSINEIEIVCRSSRICI